MVVGASVVVGAIVVVDPIVVVVGAIVVVGAAVVVVVGIVVVVVVHGAHPLTPGSEADAVESGVRSEFKIVSVTLPDAGAAPLAAQICVVPAAPVVS